MTTPPVPSAAAMQCAEEINRINELRGHVLKHEPTGETAPVMPTEEMAKIIDQAIATAVEAATKEYAELLIRARSNVEHSASHQHGAKSRQLLAELDHVLQLHAHRTGALTG